MLKVKHYFSYSTFSILLLILFFNINKASNDNSQQINRLSKIKELIKEDKIRKINGSLFKTGKTQTNIISNIKANIYVIADTSANVPSNKYANTMTNFLMNFFSNFNITPKYMNIAFSTSPGDKNLWLYLPTFNLFNDSVTLRNYIYSSYYPLDGQQSPGQSQLKKIIQMALNSEFLKTGYTDSFKPHIIFYLTTTSSPDANTIYQAQIVRNSGKFKIITIAYQPLDNIKTLESMSDCFYKAITETDLSALSLALASGVSIANANNVEYQC